MERRSRYLSLLLLLLIGSATSVEAQHTGTLHEAAFLGNVDEVQRHLNAGADLNAKDDFGSTPITVAVTVGKTNVVRFLAEAGASLSITNNDGAAPLHIAALLGHPDIVQILLDNGADRYQRTNEGATAYDIVAAPFEDDVWLYDQLSSALGPLGVKFDYDRIKKTRPAIAQSLRAQPKDLASVDYRPLTVENDWPVSLPEDRGLDPSLVAELYLDASRLENIYSLLIIKDGFLVAEKYFNGGSIDQHARLQSVTKSYTSALVGIAQSRGCLSDLDSRLVDFFPEIANNITDSRKHDVTLRQLLQMRSGYPWEESDTTLWNGLLSGRYPRLVAEFPLVAEPGTEFHYSNLSSNWLGIVVARACGMSLLDFGKKHLFAEIGAAPGPWGTDAYGNNNGCADLHMTARDAARFGLLYLNQGRHGDKQVSPEKWVKESLHPYSKAVSSGGVHSGSVGRYHRDVGYGYQWWSARVANRHFNFAWGHGGQFVVLLDDLDMVIVVTSNPFYLQHDSQAWKHEKSNLNLVGKFMSLLPGGERVDASRAPK